MNNDLIKKVWNKYFSTSENQTDAFGRTIKFNEHGNTDSNFGWEIDHIWPEHPEGQTQGGADTIRNLQPLHHESNAEKSNKLSGTVKGKKFNVSKIDIDNGKVVGAMTVNGQPAYK